MFAIAILCLVYSLVGVEDASSTRTRDVQLSTLENTESLSPLDVEILSNKWVPTPTWPTPSYCKPTWPTGPWPTEPWPTGPTCGYVSMPCAKYVDCCSKQCEELPAWNGKFCIGY